jgi:DNA modification methylase
VDLIFTDPPYEREYLDLYRWLAEEAARVLKPKGFLLAYAGGYYKATVMEYFNAHLEYFWDYIEVHPRASSVIHPRRTVARYKSILAYRRRGSRAMPPAGNILGAFEVIGGYDKRYHRWGQCERTARYLIDCFSRPEDLVLDPFVGGGTTPFVCSRIGRRFVGFEIDPETAAVAQARVVGWQPLPQQLSLLEEAT